MIYIVKILALLIGSIVLSCTPTLLASFSVFVCLCIYFPDGDPVKSETCRRDISDKWLFITDCVVFGLNMYNQSIARTIDYLKFTSLDLFYTLFFQVLTSLRLCDSGASCPVLPWFDHASDSEKYNREAPHYAVMSLHLSLTFTPSYSLSLPVQPFTHPSFCLHPVGGSSKYNTKLVTALQNGKLICGDSCSAVYVDIYCINQTRI